MSNNIRAGGIEDFSTTVDAGELEDPFDSGILVVVFVFVECRETSVVVLVALQPRVSPVYLFLEIFGLWFASHPFNHLAV